MAGNKSPIPWVGNKGCIYSVIDAFMPPHRIYLEACAGSAEVFFRKRKSGKEILNDYNGDLAHFFRVLQSSEKLALLIGRLYLSFSSEELFRANKQLLASIPNVLDDLNETVQAIDEFTWEDINRAAAFLENQVFSFSSLGEVFAIAEKDMTARFKRLITASCRLREAIILHRDYKDAIAFAAERGTFILLDPPYLGTEDYYTKSKFDKNEHERLFRFMYEIHKTYEGECKFLITYNNDPLLQDMAKEYGFYTHVAERIHSMRQGINPGEKYEELLIGNYDLEAQAVKNRKEAQVYDMQTSFFDEET
ncbi:MAG: DNA adenine methylase [Acutalibacteraceae bacterium]|nr:DNA adenine methylase [Acutalibacteraceae bacterium]